MAKSKNGILGPVSGKIGPVICSVWNGIPYIRLAPEPRSEKKKRSEAQIANEQRMTFMNNILVPFQPFIAVGFQELAIRKTALSAAYSLNYHRALIGEYPDFGIDYSQFMISTGILPRLYNSSVSLTAPNVLTLSWENGSNVKARFDDQVMLVVYSPLLHMTQGMIGGAIRRDLKFEMLLDDRLIGQALEVYVGVTSFDRKKIADSLYLGRIEP
jgi:hypothetical protein